jgi:hypothetical protein
MLSRHRWSIRGTLRFSPTWNGSQPYSRHRIESASSIKDRRNKMVFKKRTSNFVQDNMHPNCAEARAARSNEITQNPASPPTRGYLRLAERTTLNALLGGIVMLALLAPAFSQQEIDPTWYDPWGAPHQAVVQHPQSRPAGRKNQRVTSSTSPTRRKSKKSASAQTALDGKRTEEIAAKRGR